MPIIRRWTRLGFAGQLVVLLSTTLVIIAGLVIAVVALSTASTVGACVNTVLGQRNGPSSRDAAAHIDYAKADKRFSDALFSVLTLPSGSTEQRAAYRRFVVVAREKKTADDGYVRVLVADQAARNAKPFGKC